jgi:hypothetical protein
MGALVFDSRAAFAVVRPVPDGQAVLFSEVDVGYS